MSADELSSESATRLAFAALKPPCLRVLQALQLAREQRAAPLRDAARALAAVLLRGGAGRLPRSGLPRCVDYVLIPLVMALPDEAPALGAPPPPGADSLLRAITALVIAAGGAAFFAAPARGSGGGSGGGSSGGGGGGASSSGGVRVDDVLLRAAVAVSGFVERSRRSTLTAPAPAAADEDAAAALDLVWLICALLGGLGESEDAVEQEARRLVLLARASDRLDAEEQSNVGGAVSPELPLRLLLGLQRGGTATPLSPLLANRAFAGHLVSLLVEITVSAEPQAAVSAAPRNGDIPDSRPRNARFSRATRLSAVRALCAVMAVLAHARAPPGAAESAPAAPVATAASAEPAAEADARPSLRLLAPFLPGIAICLLKVVAPVASPGGGGGGELRAGSRVVAACTHALQLLLELSISDDVCREHCPAALKAEEIVGNDAAGARLSAIAKGRRPAASAALLAPAAQLEEPAVPAADPSGPPALRLGEAAWWTATRARLGQVLRLFSSHVALRELEPHPAVGAALLDLFETVSARCSATLRTSAPGAVACALLVHDRLGAAAGVRSHALQRAIVGHCCGSLSVAALAAALSQLPQTLLAHRDEDAALDVLARRARDLASAAAIVLTPDTHKDDIAAACAVWAALGQSPTTLMRLAVLQLEVGSVSGASTADAQVKAAAFLSSIVSIASCTVPGRSIIAAGSEETAAAYLGGLLLRTLRLVPMARLHLLPAAAEVAAGETDPPFLAAADAQALRVHDQQMAAAPSHFALAALGASVTVRPQNRALVVAFTSLLRALSVAALGPSGSLALASFLADSCALPGPAKDDAAEHPAAHQLAGLADAEAEAEPSLQPHWRAVQALWLGHRLLVACSAEFSASVGRFLALRAAPAAPSAAALQRQAESQAEELRLARAWAACVAGASRALVSAAAAALGLRSRIHGCPVRAWLGLLHVQAARALATVAASCGRAFDSFASRVLPLLLARAIESAGPAPEPVGEAISAALLAIAAAAEGPASALAEAQERLLPLPRPLRARRAPPPARAGGVVPTSRGPGLALQLRGALASASASADALALSQRQLALLPEGLSALLSTHVSGLADVAIAQLRRLADLARLGEDAVEGAGAAAQLVHAPRIAALLVENAAARGCGGEHVALLPLLQDMLAATTGALSALSASTSAALAPDDPSGRARGELVVALLQTLDALVRAAARPGLVCAEDAEATPVCVPGDAFRDTPLRGVASRLHAARTARALRAVRALPFLSLGARDIVVRALLAAGEHLSAAAAAFGTSGAAAAASPASAASSLQALRVTLAAMQAVMSGCEALARHPEALFPALHIVWPAIVALLPPTGFAAQALASAQARAHASAEAQPLSLAADVAAEELGPPFRQQEDAFPVGAAPATASAALCVATVGLRDEMGPAAPAAGPPGPPSLLEQSRAFMTRRAAALAQARSDAGADGSTLAKLEPRVYDAETRHVGLPANAVSSRLQPQIGGGALVVELAATATGGAASEGGTAAASARDASPSSLALLVHCAAVELVAALAAAPEPAASGARGGTRGACAGDFLRARFVTDVWPRLRSMLLACAVRLRNAAPRSSLPCRALPATAAQRLFVVALASVRRLAQPCVTIAMAPQPEESDGGAGRDAPLLPPPPTVVRLEPSVLAAGPAPGIASECAVLVALCCEGESGKTPIASAAIGAQRALNGINTHG